MENIAFMGTLAVNGKGKGIVVSTAMASTFGKVVGFLKTGARDKLPEEHKEIWKLPHKRNNHRNNLHIHSQRAHRILIQLPHSRENT